VGNALTEAETIRGRLARGLGEGAYFTGLAWAREQLVEKFGIDPFPGTVNLVVDDPGEREKWWRARARPGVTLVSPRPDWCNARCFHARIEGAIEAAVVVPEVPDYPTDQIELVAAVAVRAALAAADGDRITVVIERGPEPERDGMRG